MVIWHSEVCISLPHLHWIIPCNYPFILETKTYILLTTLILVISFNFRNENLTILYITTVEVGQFQFSSVKTHIYLMSSFEENKSWLSPGSFSLSDINLIPWMRVSMPSSVNNEILFITW